MNNFKYNEKRDASSSIDGYAYQIEYSILKWLELGRNSILELERGEDIDKVENNGRVLYQVKKRKNKIGFYSKEFLNNVINYIEHIESNPNHNIQFIFSYQQLQIHNFWQIRIQSFWQQWYITCASKI